MPGMKSRRIALIAVFGLLTAVFGLNFVSAQGIRPPSRPGLNPPIGQPNLPGLPQPGLPGGLPGGKGIGGGVTIYTCSGCGRQVSESSLSCPFCKAKFNNVGPDGKPIDGLGGARPPSQPGFNPALIQPPNGGLPPGGFVPGNTQPPGKPMNPPDNAPPANLPQVQQPAAENPAPAQPTSDQTLAIVLGIIAGVVIVIAGGVCLLVVLLNGKGGAKRRRSARSRATRRYRDEVEA